MFLFTFLVFSRLRSVSHADFAYRAIRKFCYTRGTHRSSCPLRPRTASGRAPLPLVSVSILPPGAKKHLRHPPCLCKCVTLCLVVPGSAEQRHNIGDFRTDLHSPQNKVSKYNSLFSDFGDGRSRHASHRPSPEALRFRSGCCDLLGR